MLYQSLDNPKIKDLKKLHTHKYREQKKMFLVEGEHLVLEAFQTGYLEELLSEINGIHFQKTSENTTRRTYFYFVI